MIVGQHLHLITPIILAGKLIGTVHLTSDLRELRANLLRHIGIVGGVLLASCLVAFLISSTLQGVISKPVLHLTQAIHVVSEKRDYTIRAEKQISKAFLDSCTPSRAKVAIANTGSPSLEVCF